MTRDRPVVPRPDPADRRPREDRAGAAASALEPPADERLLAHGQALGLLGPPARPSSSAHEPRTRVRARAQGAPASCRSTSASTPAPPSSSRTRRTSTRPTRTRTRRRRPTAARSMILGSGPNRIGQGIEFDYCCCHASFALQGGRLRDASWSTATRRRCRPTTTPPTGSTSSRSTLEDVLNVVETREARGRDRPVRRADAAAASRCRCTRPACRSSAPPPTRSTSPRTASASARCSTSSTSRSPRAAPPRSLEEAQAVAGAHRLPGAGAARRTCSAAARWRSSTTTSRLEQLRARGRRRRRPSTRS